MKTIILVALVAVAIASAAVIPNEEQQIERRFLKDTWKHVKDGINKVIHKSTKFTDQLKDAFKKKNINGVIKLIKNVGDDLVGSITKSFKKSKGKHLDNALSGLFKNKGKYIGHFLTGANKEVGHLFVKAGKKISHVSVFKNEKVQHFFKNVYEKSRELVKAVIRNKKFDAIVHKLIGLIDTKTSESGCVNISEQVVNQVTGSQSTGKAIESVAKTVCHTALKFVQMVADKEFEIIEKAAKKHH